MPQCQTDFSSLNRDVLFGQAGGKIIWQPRIGCWLRDKQFTGEPLPGCFEGLDLPGIYRALNCSARIYEYNTCFKRLEHPAVRISTSALTDTDTETIIQTPVGRQTMVQRSTPASWHTINLKWPIGDDDEMKVATWRERNSSWQWDRQAFETLKSQWGDLGAPTMYMPRVNVQDLYISSMGVENAVFALIDYPDTVDAYFDAMDECHDRLIDLINHSPIEIINFGDNLHARTLSPDQYERYVRPAYLWRTKRLRSAGKFVHSHWDGEVKTLLQFARTSGLNGIEAITPQPQGDVTLEQVKDALGDEIFLLDGIPAVLFDTYYPLSMLEDCAHKVIEMFAPRLVLGISDELSSTGDIERIRIVGRIVDEYNAKQ